MKNKRERTLFVSFAINVTTTCDCWNYSSAPMVPDLGFLASTDPIAIDKATVDLVDKAPMSCERPEGKSIDPNTPDKFGDIFDVNWERQLEYGEQIGLGSLDYELVRVDQG